MIKPTIEPGIVRELATILNDCDLAEIEVEHEGLRVRLARRTEAAPVAPYGMMPAYGAPTLALPPASSPVAAPVVNAAPADPTKNPNTLRAVIVGTAYLAPEPGARPFVQLGDTVRQGQTLMIIEAMKHLNQIASPRDGKVTAIFINDTSPVEFDQPLMIVE